MARSGTRFTAILKAIRNKIVVLVLAVLVGLAALEASLWVIGVVFSHGVQRGNAVPKQPAFFGWGLARENKYDPVCYFLPKGGFFRGPSGRIDRPLEKEEHTIRIMCIGDSTTYSLAVDYYQSWVYLLGTMLNEKYPEKKIEVLNAGLVGCIQKQIKRIFQFYLSKYRPDILIWRTSTNLTDTYFVDTKPDFARSFLGPFLYQLRTFRLFCVIADSFKRAGDKATADKIYDSMTGRTPEELEPSVVGFDSDFSMVRKIAQEHGTKYVLQVEYLTRRRDGGIRSEEKNKNIINGSLLKMRNAFKEKDTKSPLPANENRVNLATKLPDALFVDRCHLTEKGEAIIAEEIYKFIVGNKWIEAFN